MGVLAREKDVKDHCLLVWDVARPGVCQTRRRTKITPDPAARGLAAPPDSWSQAQPPRPRWRRPARAPGPPYLAACRAMSLAPKHTTPFSVSDILSPIEETYKKFAGGAMDGTPPAWGHPWGPPTARRRPGPPRRRRPRRACSPRTPWRATTWRQRAAAAAAAAAAATYHMPPGVSQFLHGAVGGYCNGGLGNVGERLPTQTACGRRAAAATGWSRRHLWTRATRQVSGARSAD